MFSFIPPVKEFNIGGYYPSLIKAYKIYHSTAYNGTYRSIGEKRKDQIQCIFHYTVKGSGEVIYKGKSYKTKKGEGFFNIVNEENSGFGYYEGAKEPWEFVVICFLGGNIREIVKDFMETKVIYKIENENKFKQLCKRLLKEPNTELMLTFFQKLSSMIYENDSESSGLSQKFKDIVERDILLNPTIYNIAKEIGVTREHLQREFLKENHITPAKHISYKRFEKICTLLMASYTEAEICSMMKFSSTAKMSAFFKKYAGVTPRQYKNNGYICI